MNSCFALIRDKQCITNKAVYHQPWVGVCAVTYSLIRTNVFKTMPSWLWAWSSSIALGTWRSKTFPDLKHDVLVLFYYIIIIDVEMNGVLLGTIFSASLIFLKNIRCILWDVQVVYAMLSFAFWYQKDIKIVVVPQLYEPTS